MELCISLTSAISLVTQSITVKGAGGSFIQYCCRWDNANWMTEIESYRHHSPQTARSGIKFKGEQTWDTSFFFYNILNELTSQISCPGWVMKTKHWKKRHIHLLLLPGHFTLGRKLNSKITEIHHNKHSSSILPTWEGSGSYWERLQAVDHDDAAL